MNRPPRVPLSLRGPRQRGRAGLVCALRSSEALVRLGVVLFLWSQVVAPAVHLVNHRDDHVHTPGGVKAVVAASGAASAVGLAYAHGHAHAADHGHTHGAAAGHAHGRPAGDEPLRAFAPGDPPAFRAAGPASGALPFSHGLGAAEHFGVGFLAPGPALLLTALAALVALAPAGRAGRLPPVRVARAHPTRGPPLPPAFGFARG